MGHAYLECGLQLISTMSQHGSKNGLFFKIYYGRRQQLYLECRHLLIFTMSQCFEMLLFEFFNKPVVDHVNRNHQPRIANTSFY